jgi:hypothetical protein
MTWMDEDSIEASTNFDNGNLSHAKDPSYVVHFRFIATKDQKQRFYWKPGGRAAKTSSHLRTWEREQGEYGSLLLNQQVKLPHSHKYSLDPRKFSRVFLEPFLNNMSSDGWKGNPFYPNQASKDGIEATIVCHGDAARGFAVQTDMGYLTI